MRLRTGLLGLGMMLVLSGSVAHGDADCDEPLENFKSAAHEVMEAVRQYGHCVSHSEGREDCSVEFTTLSNAHDDFGIAVSQVPLECP